MSYSNRKVLLKQISDIRGFPVISYVTSIRPNMSSQMAPDAIPFIINQIETIPHNQTEVDFLIVSNGGDPITALRVMNILRERFEKVNVIIPYSAYSAASLLALGADTIVMHMYSNLGPVDPQITSIKPTDKGVPQNIQFGSEDIKHYISFLNDDAGIKNEEYVSSSLEQLTKEVGALTIGFSKRSQNLSLSISEKMLRMHIENGNRKIAKKIKKICAYFNSSYNHSYAINRKEAQDIGLNVVCPTIELEDLLWKLWKDYEEDLKCDKPFDVINELLSNPSAQQIIKNYQVLQIPANTPHQVALQLFQQYANMYNVQTVPLDLVGGCIESVQASYQFQNKLDVAVWRNLDMNIGINVTQSSKGWIKS